MGVALLDDSTIEIDQLDIKRDVPKTFHQITEQKQAAPWRRTIKKSI